MAFVSKAGSSGPSTLLACFDDLASLSRAEPLARDLTRQVAALEEQLAAAEAALPTALSQASEQAGAALIRLSTLDAERARFEETVKTHLTVATQLASRLGPPRARLRRLREAQLVLHTLATANKLIEQVERTQRHMETKPSSQSATTSSVPLGAQSPAMQALLQLHALRTSVRMAANLLSTSVETSDDAAASAADDAPAAAAAIASLATLLDARMRALEPPLRDAFGQRAAKALSNLGWPAELQKTIVGQDSAALGEVRTALGELLLLQHCCEARGPAPIAAGGSGSGGGGGGGGGGRSGDGDGDGDGGGLWAIEALVTPVVRRFRYHFEGRRETNRRDKPEWMFTHCASLLRLHTPLLQETLPPVLLAPLLWLNGALAPPEMARAEAEAYSAMLRERCPYGIFGAVAGAICGAIRSKLRREQPALRQHARLFCHALNEAAAFDRELRDGLGLPLGVGGALPAFTAEPAALHLWLRIEGEDGRAMLERATADEGSWRAGPAPTAADPFLGGAGGVGGAADAPSEGLHASSGDGRVASSGQAAAAGRLAGRGLADGCSLGGARTVPPACAVVVMRHCEKLLDRLRLLSDEPAQRAFVHKVLVPLLDLLSAKMHTRLEMCRVGSREVGSWGQVGSLAHIVTYASPLLHDWHEVPPLAALVHMGAKDGAAAGASMGGSDDGASCRAFSNASAASMEAARHNASAARHNASAASMEPPSPVASLRGPFAPATAPAAAAPSAAAVPASPAAGGRSGSTCTPSSFVAALARSAADKLTTTARAGAVSAAASLASATADVGTEGASTAAAGPLSPLLQAWAALLAECEALVVETVTAGFVSACRPYLTEVSVRDFRLLLPTAYGGGSSGGGSGAGADGSASAALELLDLSPSLCEPLARLHAELSGMRAALPPASLRRVWPPIATAVDTLLYTQLVRRGAFSAAGARQLLRDVSALAALFVPLAARPQAALRRLHESCQLLALPRPTRLALVEAILAETPSQMQGRHEHEAALRRRLEEHGVFRIGLGEAAEILASVHDAEERT